MPKTVVISGSTDIEPHLKKWADFWTKEGFKVLQFPTKIPKNELIKEWPGVHTGFYKAIDRANFHFIANEDHKSQKGYVGNGTFTELSFSMGLNLVRKKHITIVLYQKPSRKNHFFEDIDRWEKMGWLTYMNRK